MLTEDELDVVDSINAASDMSEDRTLDGFHMIKLTKESATVGKRVVYEYDATGGETQVYLEDV
jgi:hypothetical protein